MQNKFIAIYVCALYLIVPIITLLGIKFLGVNMFANILCWLGYASAFLGIVATVNAIRVIRKIKNEK